MNAKAYMTHPTYTAKRNTIGAGSSIGSYRIVKQIGSGGMGKVFEATHSMLARRVAIKLLLPELAAVPTMSSRMAQEAAILDGLRHPSIVRIFDCGLLEDGRPWIAMELVTGESLSAKLDSQTRLSLAEVVTLLSHLADVLATAHAHGIIHRDLKPDNILYADDRAYPLRVIDWGVARHGRMGRLTLEGTTFGTPSYMSPEQIRGEGIASACDIYSLGVIAYEALVGHRPFADDTLAMIVSSTLHDTELPLAPQCPTAPPSLCELIHRMLRKDPKTRPTASEITVCVRAVAAEIAESATEFESYDLTNNEDSVPVVDPSDVVSERAVTCVGRVPR
ncbi:MAG: serine/threonine protein kinase [Myxococcota bacterium]|nr:serine/threonine protein kinase [Myxococcota bacterium]